MDQATLKLQKATTGRVSSCLAVRPCPEPSYWVGEAMGALTLAILVYLGYLNMELGCYWGKITFDHLWPNHSPSFRIIPKRIQNHPTNPKSIKNMSNKTLKSSKIHNPITSHLKQTILKILKPFKNLFKILPMKNAPPPVQGLRSGSMAMRIHRAGPAR